MPSDNTDYANFYSIFMLNYLLSASLKLWAFFISRCGQQEQWESLPQWVLWPLFSSIMINFQCTHTHTIFILSNVNIFSEGLTCRLSCSARCLYYRHGYASSIICTIWCIVFSSLCKCYLHRLLWSMAVLLEMVKLVP